MIKNSPMKLQDNIAEELISWRRLGMTDDK